MKYVWAYTDWGESFVIKTGSLDPTKLRGLPLIRERLCEPIIFSDYIGRVESNKLVADNPIYGLPIPGECIGYGAFLRVLHTIYRDITLMESRRSEKVKWVKRITDKENVEQFDQFWESRLEQARELGIHLPQTVVKWE